MTSSGNGRAALVTGASSGIGLTLTRALAQQGYAVTMVARRVEKLEDAASQLQADGHDVQAVVANVSDEAQIQNAVEQHRARHGRLDVLVNNAGVGIAYQFPDVATKHIDLQLDVNLRSVILFTRECTEMLKAAGAEHGNALILNLSSIAGKRGIKAMSVYSATKFGVVGFSEAMNQELNEFGVKSVALCPGYVDTPMTDWIKGSIAPEQMIQAQDIAEAMLFVLRLSPHCIVPEIMFLRPGDGI